MWKCSIIVVIVSVWITLYSWFVWWRRRNNYKRIDYTKIIYGGRFAVFTFFFFYPRRWIWRKTGTRFAAGFVRLNLRPQCRLIGKLGIYTYLHIIPPSRSVTTPTKEQWGVFEKERERDIEIDDTQENNNIIISNTNIS